MERLGYRPAFDGLRALAIGLVVALHYGAGVPAGGYGVDLFFVLSGFLITVLLTDERRNTGRIALGAFYARRALRLCPALFAFLAALLCVTAVSAASGHWLAPKPASAALKEVAFGATYTTNLAFVWWPHAMRPPDTQPLWSLAVEEQFYLVWPLLLIVLLALSRRMLPRLLVVAGMVVSIVAVRWGFAPATGHGAVDVATVTRFDSILVGCFAGLAFRSSWGPRLQRALARWWVLLLLLAAMGAFAMTSRPLRFWHSESTLFSLLSAALLLGVVGGGTPVAAVLSTRPLVYLGRISYPLYLWHVAVLDWCARAHLMSHGQTAGRLLALALALAAAAASYRWVEQPFLRMKARVGPARRGAPVPPLTPAATTE